VPDHLQQVNIASGNFRLGAGVIIQQIAFILGIAATVSYRDLFAHILFPSFSHHVSNKKYAGYGVFAECGIRLYDKALQARDKGEGRTLIIRRKNNPALF
jgi:hypothetical protein